MILPHQVSRTNIKLLDCGSVCPCRRVQVSTGAGRSRQVSWERSSSTNVSGDGGSSSGGGEEWFCSRQGAALCPPAGRPATNPAPPLSVPVTAFREGRTPRRSWPAPTFPALCLRASSFSLCVLVTTHFSIIRFSEILIDFSTEWKIPLLNWLTCGIEICMESEYEEIEN